MVSTTDSRAEQTDDQLRHQLEDPDVRRRYYDILSIGELLQGCVIDKTYRVTDDLAIPIRLSSLGEKILAEIRGDRPRLKPNDVKLSIFMAFGCTDGLLVDPATDVDGMRRAIDREIKERKILYPYIFGRELHDRVAMEFPEVSRLENAQTVGLLRDSPVGVYQVGYHTVGPFGAILSDSSRALTPDQRFPGYLCSDATCSAVHAIFLSTASDSPGGASIVKASEYVASHIGRRYSQGDDSKPRIIQDALAREGTEYFLRFGDSLIEVLADDFSTDELRAVAEVATRAHFNAVGSMDLAKRLGAVIQNPTEFISHLERPALLQLLLVFSEEALVSAVDATLASGLIQLSEYEVRERRISRFGRSDLVAEVGQQGARYTGIGINTVVARRLATMLHKLYYESGSLSPRDLAYLLEQSAESDSDMNLLDRAVQDMSPERIVRELILNNFSASREAAAFLGISMSESATKSELLPTFLWKLGAPIEVEFTDLHRVERLEEELAAAMHNPSLADEEQLRGKLSNLFTALEDAAQRAIEFSTWALTCDHFLSDDGFLYDPAPNPQVLTYLDDNVPAGDGYGLKANGRNTLAPLAAAFGRLAKALDNEDAAVRGRPLLQYPVLTRYTARPFGFPKTVPFLNLSDPSRGALLSALKKIAGLLGDDTVLRVRNGAMHGNAPFPSAAEITLTLERIAHWRTVLLAAGLYPRVYRLRTAVQDDLGRRRHHYYSREDDLYITDPSWAYAPGLPTGAPQLVIVSGAYLPSAGPLRFLLKSRPGRDPYWEGWPNRWTTNTASSTSTSGAYGVGEAARGRSDAL